MNKKQVKEIVKQILKENECIVITSEGMTLIQGHYQHTINSISFMLKQIYRDNRDAFDEIMQDVDKFRCKEEPVKKEKHSNKKK